MLVQALSNNKDKGGVTGMALYNNQGEFIASYPMPVDSGGDGYGYDLAVNPTKNVLLTSSFTGHANYMRPLGELIKDEAAMKRFGNTMVVWDLKAMKPKKVLPVPGAPLEIRWSLNPGDNWAVTAAALTSKLWLVRAGRRGAMAGEGGGDHRRPGEDSAARGHQHHPRRQGALGEHVHGRHDPLLRPLESRSAPKQTYEKHTGRQVNMISQSWDGTRVYITSSLLANWDKAGADNEQFLRGFAWDGKELKPGIRGRLHQGEAGARAPHEAGVEGPAHRLLAPTLARPTLVSPMVIQAVKSAAARPRPARVGSCAFWRCRCWLARGATRPPGHADDPAARWISSPPQPGTYELHRIMRAPDGPVLTVDGRLEKLSRFTRERITLLGFIYTSCTDPAGLPARLSGLRPAEGRDPGYPGAAGPGAARHPELRSRPRLASVMKRYAGSRLEDEGGLRWFFLTTPSVRELLPLVEGFGQDVRYARGPLDRPARATALPRPQGLPDRPLRLRPRDLHVDVPSPAIHHGRHQDAVDGVGREVGPRVQPSGGAPAAALTARGPVPTLRAMPLRFAAVRLALTLTFLATSLAQAESIFDDARLLRFPDIHEGTIAFTYAGDIFTVDAAGGTARRLTAGEGLELFPRFSPDGKWIAFTGQYDGTSDVYVIPAAGGEPRRLTFYPSQTNSERMGWDNMVIGWTPEGKILFRGQRNFINGFVGEPYVVSPEGGPVERFPLPESGIISFAPDGKRIAYTRIFRDFRTWKRYKGGMAQDVWIYDLASKGIEKITSWPGTDTQPMWIGDAIYFLSDRDDWKLNLWRYDLATKQTSRVTQFTEFDVKWPHAGSGQIVFENGGYLYRLDPTAPEPRKVQVRLPDDRRYARPRYVSVADRITSFSLSPGGQRAVLTARGEVFTVPAEHGNTRNLTGQPGRAGEGRHLVAGRQVDRLRVGPDRRRRALRDRPGRQGPARPAHHRIVLVPLRPGLVARLEEAGLGRSRHAALHPRGRHEEDGGGRQGHRPGDDRLHLLPRLELARLHEASGERLPGDLPLRPRRQEDDAGHRSRRQLRPRLRSRRQVPLLPLGPRGEPDPRAATSSPTPSTR